MEAKVIEMDSKFHVGDKVVITNNTLNYDSADSFVGTKQEVKSVQWCDLCGRYEYRVKSNSLLWNDDDFEFDIQTELPEFSTEVSDLTSLFS